MAAKVNFMEVKWFLVVCAECVRRYGFDRTPPTFRAEVENWGNARVEVRRRSRDGKDRTSWVSLNVTDDSPDYAFSPVVNCDHNHRFEGSDQEGDLVTRIGTAITEAIKVGASAAVIAPNGKGAASERSAIRRDRERNTIR